MEFGHSYDVTLSSSGAVSCSCLRYNDEEIPCQHIVRVLSDKGETLSLRALIGDIYLKENYLLAFPDKPVFVPKDCACYSSNPLVVIPPSTRKIGATRTRRFCSHTDHRRSRGGSLPNSVARPPPRTSGDDDDDSEGYSDNDGNVDTNVDDGEGGNGHDDDDESRGPNPPGDIIVIPDDEDSMEEENRRRVDTNLSELGGDPDSTEQPGTDWSATRITLADVTIPLSRFQVGGQFASTYRRMLRSERTESPSKRARTLSGPAPESAASPDPFQLNPDLDSHPDSDSTPCSDHVPEPVHEPAAVVPVQPGNVSAPNRLDNRYKRVLRSLPQDWSRTLTRIISHDACLYSSWKDLYVCISSLRSNHRLNVVHDLMQPMEYIQAPSAERKAVVHVVPNVSISEASDGNYWQLSSRNEWPESMPKPILSLDLIRTLLGYVHSFTTLGLEAQAMAYSAGMDGVIKYLALFPQYNEPDNVTDAPSQFSGINAIFKFQEHDGTPDPEYSERCWIHTHARHRAYMSHLDIYQMFGLEQSGPAFSFSLVLSPRCNGLQALAVRLTEAGRKEVEQYRNEAKTISAAAATEDKSAFERQHVLDRINGSPTKFYYQVPITLSDDPCVVVDFRSKEEVERSLKKSVVDCSADNHWLARHTF